MIEKIELSSFKLKSNNVLVKLDSAFDMAVVQGPGGTKVELKLIYFGENEVNSYAISGTVVAAPEKSFFFSKSDFYGSQEEFAASMKESTDVDTDYDIAIGDKVYFNYNAQLSALEELRVLDTEEHGHCILIALTSLFAVEKANEIQPVNGYVFFVRDEIPTEVFNNGIYGIQKENKYGSPYGTVTVADQPVKRYLDGHPEPRMELKKGDRIAIDKRFGYRMAYDLHAGELKKVEVIQRKNILGVIEGVPYAV